MADYIISVTELPDSDYEQEEVQPLNSDYINFIDDGEIEDDVCFYRSIDHKKIVISDDEETPVPVLKYNVGKRRIESDSESDSESEDEFVIPNCDETGHKIGENKIVIPEVMCQFYGADIRNFLHLLCVSSGDNVSMNLFLPMSKNYVSEKENHYDMVDYPLANEDDSKKFKQSKHCFYLDLLYAIRHVVSGKYSHTRF